MSSINIDLDRCDRIYRDGEKVKGKIVIDSEKGFNHGGIEFDVSGTVKLSLNPSSVGLLETFYSSVKPQELMKIQRQVRGAGEIPPGKTSIPFSFDAKPLSGMTLYPSFHGVYITIAYDIKVSCETRGWTGTTIEKSIEFIMDRLPDKNRDKGKAVDFKISKDALENVHKSVLKTLPQFVFVGRLPMTRCPVNTPFTGELEIKEAEKPIRSISLQLVRVETVMHPEGSCTLFTRMMSDELFFGVLSCSD